METISIKVIEARNRKFNGITIDFGAVSQRLKPYYKFDSERILFDNPVVFLGKSYKVTISLSGPQHTKDSAKLTLLDGKTHGTINFDNVEVLTQSV